MAFFSLAPLSRFTIHRHTGIWKFGLNIFIANKYRPMGWTTSSNNIYYGPLHELSNMGVTRERINIIYHLRNMLWFLRISSSSVKVCIPMFLWPSTVLVCNFCFIRRTLQIHHGSLFHQFLTMLFYFIYMKTAISLLRSISSYYILNEDGAYFMSMCRFQDRH